MLEARGPVGRLAFTPQSPSIASTSALGTAQPELEPGPELPKHVTKSSQPPSEIRSTKGRRESGRTADVRSPVSGEAAAWK
eukprot:10595453-Alexandrium_andersonii.AAC.1